MRRFIVLGHTQRSTPPIPLNDPAGAGGRWDLLARCITSALLVSHGARRDTELVLALSAGSKPRAVRLEGASIRSLNPDERSTIALVSKALGSTDVGSHESSPHPGIHVSRRLLSEILASARSDSTLVWLREDASVPIDSWTPPSGSVTFILSDHRDPTTEERSLIEEVGAGPLSLGPVALQADQCIVIVHNRLDRDGPRPG